MSMKFGKCMQYRYTHVVHYIWLHWNGFIQYPCDIISSLSGCLVPTAAAEKVLNRCTMKETDETDPYFSVAFNYEFLRRHSGQVCCPVLLPDPYNIQDKHVILYTSAWSMQHSGQACWSVRSLVPRPNCTATINRLTRHSLFKRTEESGSILTPPGRCYGSHTKTSQSISIADHCSSSIQERLATWGHRRARSRAVVTHATCFASQLSSLYGSHVIHFDVMSLQT